MVARASAERSLGRQRERGALERLLDTVRGGNGAVLVMHGEPGVGKTALLDYAVEAAPDFRVARAVGVEGEMELAFAALQPLCAPFSELADHLARPQRDALAVAFGLSAGPAAVPILRQALDAFDTAGMPAPSSCGGSGWRPGVGLPLGRRDNGLGRYEEARAAALRVTEHPHELAAANGGIAELVEASVRAGTLEGAAEAQSRLAEMTEASGTDWALGIAARTRALLAEGRQAEELYGSRCASCARDPTPSLRNTLRRWYSTVLTLMNSRASPARLWPRCRCSSRIPLPTTRRSTSG